MRLPKTSSLIFVLGAFTACGGGHGGSACDGAASDAGDAGGAEGGADAIPDASDEAAPGDAGADEGFEPLLPVIGCFPLKVVYTPLFTGDAASQTPIAFTDPATGHIIFRGAGRLRMGHEMEEYYATYPPQYFENRTFGYLLDDAVAAGGATITSTIQTAANAYYHKQKLALASSQQGGFDMNFRAWKKYGTVSGNSFFGNLVGLDFAPKGCDADPDGPSCDTRTWTFPVEKNDREDRPMRVGDQLQVEWNVALAEYGGGQGPPADNTHVRNLLPLPNGCTLNGAPFTNSCYTQSFYRATDSFRYVVGKGTLTPANEDCTIAVPLDVQQSLPEPYDCSASGNVGRAITAGTLSDRLGPAPAGWSGGTATIPYLRSRHDLYYQQMAPSTLVENAESFVQGRFLFYLDFGTGQSTEPYHSLSDAEIAARAHLAGPRYAQTSCVGCHMNNNRGAAPKAGAPLDTFRVRLADLSSDAHGRSGGDALAGRALQVKSVGGAAEGTAVAGTGSTRTVTFADGTTVVLTKPSFQVTVPGEQYATYSARVAPPLVGLGLLEAIADEDIVAHADPSGCANNGAGGWANIVYDDEDGTMKVGRFGWRATTASLRQAVAESLNLDLGVTTTVYPTNDCGAKQVGCDPASGSKPELSDVDLARLVTYMRDGAVPPRRDLADPTVMRGEALFGALGCASCHTTTFTTGESSPFLELRHQTIHPYSDLLLHDMGPDLADNNFPQESAARSTMWRTPPLWGIGLCDEVAAGYSGPSYNLSPDLGPCHYLHDGRAATLLEAILWHDGQARSSRVKVESLTASDRRALVAFLRSL